MSRAMLNVSFTTYNKQVAQVVALWRVSKVNLISRIHHGITKVGSLI